MTEFIRIETIRPFGSAELLVNFSNGQQRVVDFAHLIARGGMWAALADPDFFAKAQIDEYSRGVVWPNGADSCADAMYERSTVPHAVQS